MLKLHHSLISTCSQKVRLTLHLKGLEFTSRIVNLGAEEHLTPEYLALNPNGVVPTLEHDDNIILDSSVIMEYLEEAFPQTPLMPDTPVGRAHVRAWMRYIEEVPTVAIRYPSFNDVLVKGFKNLSPQEFEQAAKRRPLRTDFYRRMGQQGFEKDAVDNSLEQLRQTAKRMSQALENSNYIATSNLTIADLAVIPTFDRMADLGLSHIWEDLPRVCNWWAEMQSMPAYAATYCPGARLSDIFKW